MLIKQGLRLVASGSVTQANSKLATASSGAMIDIGIDLSAYAGTDAGSTPYMLIYYDSAGNRMQGFIGANGGGETLGAELISNPGFEGVYTEGLAPDWGKYGLATVSEDGVNLHGGTAAQRVTVGAGNEGLYQTNLVVQAQKLYSAEVFCYPHSLAGWVGFHSSTTARHAATSGIGSYEKLGFYFTCKLFPFGNIYLASLNIGADLTFDDASLKQVTDVSVQGIHLHSTRGGINRNVASIDSSFNLDDSSGFTFKIYKCP